MANLGDFVQKALYLGIGIADLAAEKAGGLMQELRIQAQKLADEMVARGEMTTEEARKYVDDILKQAQQNNPTNTKSNTEGPRPIEIEIDDEESIKPTGSSVQKSQQSVQDVDRLRRQVEALKEDLRRLRGE